MWTLTYFLSFLRRELTWYVERQPRSQQEIRQNGSGWTHVADVDAEGRLRKCLSRLVSRVVWRHFRALCLMCAGVGVVRVVVLSQSSGSTCTEASVCQTRDVGEVSVHSTNERWLHCFDRSSCLQRFVVANWIHMARSLLQEQRKDIKLFNSQVFIPDDCWIKM